MRNLLNYEKNEQFHKAELISTSFRNMAFTLAEVLITLGIIGVVAAMTMPSLIQKYQEKVTVAKLKKVYNIMSNGYIRAKSDYGTMDMWELGIDKGDSIDKVSKIIDIFSKYIKIVSKCNSNCKNWDVYNLNGQLDNTDKYMDYAILADGTSISNIYINSSNCDINFGSGPLKNGCGSFKVDLNGNKKPNTYGKDIFEFIFTKEAVVAIGANNDRSTPVTPSDPYAADSTANCFVEGRLAGIACTAWVIYNENMDYLHCPEKLSWNGKHKCSD